jgi:tripeptidyl-peptidase-2
MHLACVGGTVHRRFVTVPEGASYVDFTVTAHSFRAADGSDQGVDPTRSFMFHALYLQPEHAFDDHESNSFFSLTGESPKKDLRMDVRPGQTLEVCITQYWSSIGPCAVDVAVEFQGLAVDNADEDASSSFSPVNFRSVLRSTKLAPSAQCKTWHSVVKPSSSVLAPLTKERDFIVLGSKLLNALTLTYNFELKEDSSTVKVRAPALNERLYESVFESQLTQIFDTNRRFCFATDASPSADLDGSKFKSLASTRIRIEAAGLVIVCLEVLECQRFRIQ